MPHDLGQLIATARKPRCSLCGGYLYRGECPASEEAGHPVPKGTHPDLCEDHRGHRTTPDDIYRDGRTARRFRDTNPGLDGG